MIKEKSSTVTAITIVVAVASFLTFFVLKLCGVLAWSWWWVFAPLWAPSALIILNVVLMKVFIWAFERH